MFPNAVFEGIDKATEVVDRQIASCEELHGGRLCKKYFKKYEKENKANNFKLKFSDWQKQNSIIEFKKRERVQNLILAGAGIVALTTILTFAFKK